MLLLLLALLLVCSHGTMAYPNHQAIDKLLEFSKLDSTIRRSTPSARRVGASSATAAAAAATTASGAAAAGADTPAHQVAPAAVPSRHIGSRADQAAATAGERA